MVHFDAEFSVEPAIDKDDNETHVGAQQLGTWKEGPGNQSANDLLEEVSFHRHGGHDSGRHHGKGDGSRHKHPEKIEAPSKGNLGRRENSYWGRVNAAKAKHEYVSEYPPVYPGMDKPRPIYLGAEAPSKQGSLPSINDTIVASKDLNRIALKDKKQPEFTLSYVDEDTFKQRYSKEAIRVGALFGLKKDAVEDIVTRIYAFEDGGWGTAETLSNMPQYLTDEAKTKERRAFHPISSAIGYNQLLIANSVNEIQQYGKDIADRLKQLAVEDPTRAKELADKAKMVENLQAVSRSPGSKLSNAMHALNIDGDIGPIVQSQELANLLKYAKEKDFPKFLKERAEITRNNATLYDVLPPEKKIAAVNEVIGLLKPVTVDPPTTDPDFQKPWDQAKEGLRQKLIGLPPEVSDTLAKDKLTDNEFTLMNMQLLQLRKFGGDSGPMSPDARKLMDKINFVYFGGITGEKLMPAALELANLAGDFRGLGMIQAETTDLPTSNFFARNGYDRNPVVSRRSSAELLTQIDRVMHGPNGSPLKPGVASFHKAFQQLPEAPPAPVLPTKPAIPDVPPVNPKP